MLRNTTLPPFGLAPALPAFDRATHMAKVLFDAVDSTIVLVDNGHVWRSRAGHGELPANDPLASIVMTSGETVRIEDARADPAHAERPMVKGGLQIRFYAAAPVRLADGSTPGVICVVDRRPRAYDATLAKCLQNLAAGIADECDRARAKAEAARSAAELDRTRAVLSAFIDTVPASIFMADRDMVVLKASPAWFASFALTEADVVGRSVYDIAPEYFGRFRRAFDRCLAGETIRDDRLRSVIDGQQTWLQTELTPWRNHTGEIGGLIVVAHDVTEMVEALDRSQRSEDRLRLAMQLVKIQIFEIDHDRRQFSQDGVGPADGSRMDYDNAVDSIWNSVHPEDRPDAEALWLNHVKHGAAFRTSYRVVRPDGSDCWVEAASEAVRGADGQLQRVVGAIRDIDQEKRNELDLVHARDAAETANRAKSTFLATMSHEIRTPLNGVLGMAQAMVGDALSATQRERLDVIRQSGEALLAILNDVLDLSKIEAGKLELESTEFSMAKLARGAHAAFSALASKKGLGFRLDIEPAAQGVYRGDSTRVRQILYNLISNALKFTEAGEVRVDLARAADGLRIVVSDTGIGIAPDRLAVLFQKFEQADASTTRRYGGTGLGLAICRELAELMGGQIHAESQEGHGARFVVQLPIAWLGADRDEGTPDTGAPSEPAMVDGAAQLKVLAAEDNAVNRLVLKTLLNQAGIEPMLVADGALALEAWEGGSWDVILMDIQMPVMDGPTATAEIRRRERASGRARTPIIALTANAMAHQVDEYAKAEMDGFVAKPIEIARLFEALEAVLAASTQDSEIVGRALA
jgi:PAS domain S-box-containing protein